MLGLNWVLFLIWSEDQMAMRNVMFSHNNNSNRNNDGIDNEK